MRLCPNSACKHSVPPAARFCPRCGERVGQKGPLIVLALVGFIVLGLIGLRLAAISAIGARPSYPPNVQKIIDDAERNHAMSPFTPSSFRP